LFNSFNIEDFDEEINGINLSKLFSVYGPNSNENKKRAKKRLSDNPNKKQYSSRVRSSGGGSTKRSLVNDSNNVNAREEEEAAEDDDETIVIKLMANMFTKKKSVREKLLMDPAISVDKLRQELRWHSIEEQA
jgi:hypothetical protein